MKNLQKGFIVPLLIGIIIIVVLLISGGAYIYQIKKTVQSESQNTQTQISNHTMTISDINISTKADIKSASPKTVVVNQELSVTGMEKYTDSVFGYSFWYPSSWVVNENTNVNLGNIYTDGVITKETTIASPRYPRDGIAIDEFYSNNKSITDNSVCGPADGCPSSVRYYFDSNAHTWMKDSNMGYGQGQYSLSNIMTVATNVSTNSMGGLHILNGNARFGDDVIVPLSASNFLIVRNMSAGTNKVFYLANTIVALDPAVATPLSLSHQIDAIRAEKNEYNFSATSWSTYNFGNNKIDYPSDLTIQNSPGGWNGDSPIFSFPSSYLVGSNLYEAKINIMSSVGNDPPTGTQVNINGTNWTMSDLQSCSDRTGNCNRVIIYGIYGAGNTSWNLSLMASDKNSLNSLAAQNIISIFTKMVGTYI